MKKLLFIGIVALMVQSLGAVTLPSSSYSPYSGGGSESSEVVFGSGSMVTGSFSSLGGGMPSGYQEQFDACVSTYPEQGSVERMSCCESVSTDCANACGSDYECIVACGSANKSCVEAGSLPLDGGLSILLILSLAGGAAKLLRNKRS